MDAIEVNSELCLTQIHESDRELLVEYLSDREIHDNTLQIPYPYTLIDADQWIALNTTWAKNSPYLTHFAIRDKQGLLLGGADFHDLVVGKSHKAEIGYWMAKRFWGKGYMTAVVGKLVHIGFEEFKLKRITACVFAPNNASARCLEKNGFEFEGYLKNYYLKNGQLTDARMYAKIPASGGFP